MGYLTRDLRTVHLFDLAYPCGLESSDDPDGFLSPFTYPEAEEHPGHGELPCGSTSGGWTGIDRGGMRWDCPLNAVRPYLYWRNDGYFSLNLTVHPIDGYDQDSLLPSHGDLLDLFVRCSNGLYSSEDG